MQVGFDAPYLSFDLLQRSLANFGLETPSRAILLDQRAYNPLQLLVYASIYSPSVLTGDPATPKHTGAVVSTLARVVLRFD